MNFMKGSLVNGADERSCPPNHISRKITGWGAEKELEIKKNGKALKSSGREEACYIPLRKTP
jgi:hypothetical protein